MGSGGWRWWLRTRCMAIATVDQHPSGLHVLLCHRWRWHRGACRQLDAMLPASARPCTCRPAMAAPYVLRVPSCPTHGDPPVRPPTGL